MRVLSEDDVRASLDLGELADALAAAHAALSDGRARNPERFRVDGGAGALAAMPAYLPGVGLGIKALTGFLGNRERGLPNTQAVVLIFSEGDGRPLAVISATYLTAARTAAAGALSTRLLARLDSRTLVVIGAGFQAPSHVLSNLSVRPFQRVLLCGRRIDSARALQRELATCADVPVEVAPDLESAVRAADVVVACTSSNTPVVMNDWVRPGTHVVSVASRRPTTQELDPLLIARSRFVVDSKTAARVELGDYLVPLSQGLIDESHIWAELGELVNGARVGRSSPEQITVYKSAGLAIQDLAAAGLLIGK